MQIHNLGILDSKPNKQDGAIFNGYLFRFGSVGNCTVYNIEECVKEGNSLHKPIAAFTLDKAEIILPHSNSVMFSNTYYCEGDEFPLLYTNIYTNHNSHEDKLKGVTCVYRITRTDDGFKNELVQIIRVGFTEDKLWKSENTTDCRPFGNFVIDYENSKYYAFTMRDEDNTTRYFAFDLPKVTDGIYDEKFGVKCAVLKKEDIKEYFDIEYHKFMQGACCHKGFIYSVEGFTNNTGNPPALRIIDIKNKKQSEFYLFGDYGLSVEPELIDFYNDICYYSDDEGNFYRLEF